MGFFAPPLERVHEGRSHVLVALRVMRSLIPILGASHTRMLRCTPQSAYTRLDSFLDRFAAFFSFGVRVAFFFSSLLFLISLGMVFAPIICVWGAVIAATDNNPGSVNLARKIREIVEAADPQRLTGRDDRQRESGQGLPPGTHHARAR